ncbi:unnamed protein product [Pieris macdunnoughi]|uniref:Uncharacterized protein n=1 Tax=Pieris macdunnoughi TaxID=345717 RepID=A0A821WJ46_9NEOP|nr:unnamed protein product [Pieris macdunnoughi]
MRSKNYRFLTIPFPLVTFALISIQNGAADGPPDGAELDQYLKPAPMPEYHEMQPRYTHSLTTFLPLHPRTSLTLPCPEWHNYPGHP